MKRNFYLFIIVIFYFFQPMSAQSDSLRAKSLGTVFLNFTIDKNKRFQKLFKINKKLFRKTDTVVYYHFKFVLKVKDTERVFISGIMKFHSQGKNYNDKCFYLIDSIRIEKPAVRKYGFLFYNVFKNAFTGNFLRPVVKICEKCSRYYIQSSKDTLLEGFKFRFINNKIKAENLLIFYNTFLVETHSIKRFLKPQVFYPFPKEKFLHLRHTINFYKNYLTYNNFNKKIWLNSISLLQKGSAQDQHYEASLVLEPIKSNFQNDTKKTCIKLLPISLEEITKMQE